MTIIDEINKEIAICDEEIKTASEIVLLQNERLKCYREQRSILENLLHSATAEQEKSNKTKAKQSVGEKAEPAKKPVRTERKTDDAPVPAANSEPDSKNETNDAELATVSMKAIADNTGTPQSEIASICNELGFELKMVNGKYMLTDKQACAVRKALKERSAKPNQ